MKKRLVGAGLLAACVASCAGSQTRLAIFSTDWEDDGGYSIQRVWQKLANTPIPASIDVVVGVSRRADKLIGLAGGRTGWTFAHALDARPIVVGKVVVGSGAGEVFALDGETGGLLWRRPMVGVGLLGAGDDGAVTVVTFRRAGLSGSLLLAVAHNGAVVRQVETTNGLGTPAVLGRMAFVPWSNQYVSVIDLGSGDETARVTLRSQTSRAWLEGGSLWFGEIGYTRFDEHIGEASKGRASTATLPARELPGIPRLMPPGGAPVPPLSNAEDKARLYARPAGEGQAGAGIENGRFYATYFRIAMGFDVGQVGHDPKQQGDAGKLAWVHLHGADFVGGAAEPGGIVLCDEKGRVTALDAQTGGVLDEADVGEPLGSCVVSVDAQHASGASSVTKAFAAQLAEAVLADDPQLVVAQRLLLRELVALNDETATKALVDLASDPRTSPPLLADARKALANRRNGASYMEAALARHYDFLKDVLRAPPVGPIAQALGAMKERAAAPLLASHLLDPADTDDDVMRAAAALAVIAGPGEAPVLREFFGMYRATAEGDDMAAAVVSVGQALMTVDEKGGRTMVESAAADASTVAYARERLAALASVARKPAGTALTDAGGGEKKGK